MGSMSRKFLSLIVNEHTPGFKTLRCIDLTLQKLFYDAPQPSAAAPDGDGGSASSSAGEARDAAAAATSRTPLMGLPRPSFTFRPGDSDENDEWGLHCFPLRDRRVVCIDQSGHAMAFDGEARVVGTISEKGEGLAGGPKRMPLSLSSFSTVRIWTSLKSSCLCDEAIFVMEKFPEPELEEEDSDQDEAFINAPFFWVPRRPPSGQFEAFFKINDSGYWIRRLLRPPPFAVLNGPECAGPGPVEITAYTVVGRRRCRPSVCVRDDDGTYYFEGGSRICVSAAGAGTYCMDTAPRHRWTQVGEWVLPFRGKVEYVPELELWFGFSAESRGRRLAAADLAGMGSRKMAASKEPPQLVGTWQEIDPPEEWRECRDPQMVNLGSGRFCIARFFKTSSDDGETGEDFAVLTGVEMVPCLDDDSQAGGGGGKGKKKKVMKLRMITHKSRRLHGGGTIDTVF